MLSMLRDHTERVTTLSILHQMKTKQTFHFEQTLSSNNEMHNK